MADFSRIRVTPAEEEDIVIMAGAVEDVVPTEEDLSSTEETPVEETTVVEEEPSGAASRGRGVAYEETTLEDLQRTRMSGMQKAIIALAIVAVAAFIIWYVFLH